MPYVPPLAWVAISWLAGIAFGSLLPPVVWAWLLAASGGAVAAVFFGRRRRLRWAGALVAVFALGAARWAWAQPVIDPSHVAFYNGSDHAPVTAVIEGFVVAEPDVRDTHVNVRLAVDSIQLNDHEPPMAVRGIVLAQTPRHPPPEYGARIRLSGLLQTPPAFEEFSYRDYLARQGVFSLLRYGQPATATATPPPAWLGIQFAALRPIFAFKALALAALHRTFPQPHGALLSGILLGVESGIPPELQNAFRLTGTSHIIAISGFNVSLLARLFVGLFRRVMGKRRAIAPTILLLALYAVLAGASASVVRAAIMGSLVLLADGFHRRANGLASLAGAAMLMTLLQPGALWDVGFQLSVAATLGLILYADPLLQFAEQLLARRVAPRRAKQIVAFAGEFSVLTLAAQLTTLPLMAYYFHQISLVSLVANLVILPAQPYVMIFGGVALIGALAHGGLGAVLFWLAYPFVAFTIVMVEWFAAVPLASIAIDRFPLAVLGAMYVGLAIATRLATPPRPSWFPAARDWLAGGVLTATAVSALAAWSIYLHLPDGQLHVTFLDIEHGAAVLIQTPGGRYALIDGGASPTLLADALGRRLPPNLRALDLVFAASSRAQSVGGLPGLLGRYSVRRAAFAGQPGRNSAYAEWHDAISRLGIPALAVENGTRFDLGDGAIMTVLDVRDSGATIRLDYGAASFLLPIGLNARAATELVSSRYLQPATVLLISGEDDATSAHFLDSAQPWAVVISAAAGDVHPQTLNLLRSYTVLRTDQHGAIDFATDGKQLFVLSQR